MLKDPIVSGVGAGNHENISLEIFWSSAVENYAAQNAMESDVIGILLW